MSSAPFAVFPVLYLGRLPAFFPFWARSCQYAGDGFRWVVYNNHITQPVELNPAVSLVPYTVEQLHQDYRSVLGIDLHPNPVPKKPLEVRAFMYFLRKDTDGYAHYPYWGMTDIDMVYGNLRAFIPDADQGYGMISAHDGRPCGPFTLFHRDATDAIFSVPNLKERIADSQYHLLEESPELSQAIAASWPIWGDEKRLQPWRDPALNRLRMRGYWSPGSVTVSDGTHARPAAFFHFSKQKRKKTFRPHAPSVEKASWVIDESGIWSPGCPVPRLRGAIIKSTYRLASLIRSSAP